MNAPQARAALTHRQYTALPGVSASQLRELRQGSPLHLRHYLDTPDADTASRGMLRAIHCRVLEPHRYPIDFATFEGRRGGQAWEAWKTAQEDRTILSERETEAAKAISAAVLAHPLVGPLFGGRGYSELSITWTDQVTGLHCRARLDRLRELAPGRWQVIDLKTVDSTAAHRVTSLAGQQGWHVQLAHYLAAVRAIAAPDAEVSAALVVVEQAAPHDAAVFELPLTEELIAEQERRALLATYAECQRSGVWLGRYTEPQPLALPRYLYPDEEGVHD